MRFSLTLRRFEAGGRKNRVSAVNEIRYVRRVELSPEKARGGLKTITPVLFSPPVQPSDSGVFYFYEKPLVVKGFAKQYPIPRILRREPLPGGLAPDFNEKRPKFSGRLEQATSPRRSPENRLNEKHTPV